jgi:hypothetical protein
MRESSGKYCAGRDRSASNTDAETVEAGLFQTSFNARTASLLLPTLFAAYSKDPSGFIDVFKEGVRCSSDDLANFGSGDGAEFQRLSKACPGFAAEFAAVGLRHIRKHWGPINRKAAEILPECDTLLREIQAIVDASLDVCSALKADPVATGSSAPTTLRRGMESDDVPRLQEALRQKGFTVAVDRVFGQETEAAVRQFQANRGLTVDGIVGPATWTQLT